MKRHLTILLLLAFCTASQAREVFPLNEGWRFFLKSENSSDNARHVTLPHTWNTDARWAGVWYETTANYRNDLFIPRGWSSKRLFLKFHGAQSVANLFVNGLHAGSHRGGATAFTFEITDKVEFGADNSLLVVVSNADRDDVLPTSTDMNLYGGLYREVELIVTERTAVSPLYLGSDGILVQQTSVADNRVDAQAQVHLLSAGEHSCSLTLTVTAPDGTQVFSKQHKVRLDGKPVSIPFSIDNPALWSPETPALYNVNVRIGDAATTDSVSVRTGFRAIRVTPTGGLTINGRRVPVHGVALHHDNAIASGALREIDYDGDLAQVRDLGANALRSAIMPHAQYLYDRCDEQGLLVWIDAPLQRAPFLGDAAYFATEAFRQNGSQQLRELIAQNYNHPSVVMWGLFSRLLPRGDNIVPYLRTLNDAAHAMDASRPTTACSDRNGEINSVTDLIVLRQTVGWNGGTPDDLYVWRAQLQKSWSTLRVAVAYGGEGFIGHRRGTAKSNVQSNWLPEERQTRFHEGYARVLQNDSLFWGLWIDNMFDFGSARRPYGINGEGLVTIDRREHKDAYWLYRALWNKRQPTLRITDRHNTLREGGRQAFGLYSSVAEPQLFVNGSTVELIEYGPCQYRTDSMTLRGRVELKAVAGALRDSMTIRVGNSLKPRR